MFQLDPSDAENCERDEEFTIGHLLSHIAWNNTAKLLAAATDNTINIFTIDNGKYFIISMELILYKELKIFCKQSL